MKNKIILITGITGFIGRNLWKKINELKPGLGNKNIFIFYRGRLENKDELLKMTKNVDYVVHLASETQKPDLFSNVKANVIGTKNVIEVCRTNNVKKIIFTSTVNADFKVLGNYGKSKKIAEELIKCSGLDYIILKLNMVYGDGDRSLSKTIKLIKYSFIIPIIGDGNKYIQPVYVGDVCDVIIKSMEKDDLKNKVYNIAGIDSFTFKEYIRILLYYINPIRMRIYIPVSIARWFAFLTREHFITYEIINSITQDKSVNISETLKDFDFNPVDFREMIRNGRMKELKKEG